MNEKMREIVSYVGEGRIMDARSLFEEGCEAVKAGYLRIDSSRHQAYFVPTAAGTSLSNVAAEERERRSEAEAVKDSGGKR